MMLGVRTVVSGAGMGGDVVTGRGLGIEAVTPGTVLFLQVSAGYMDMLTLWKSIELHISDWGTFLCVWRLAYFPWMTWTRSWQADSWSHYRKYPWIIKIKVQRHPCPSVSSTQAPSQRDQGLGRGWEGCSQTRSCCPGVLGVSCPTRVTEPYWFFLPNLASIHPSISFLESYGEVRANNVYLQQSKSPTQIPVPQKAFPVDNEPLSCVPRGLCHMLGHEARDPHLHHVTPDLRVPCYHPGDHK